MKPMLEYGNPGQGIAGRTVGRYEASPNSHTHSPLVWGRANRGGRANNGDISDENGTDGLSFPHIALPSPQEEDERRHQAGIAALGA